MPNYFRINRPDGGRNDRGLTSTTYPDQNSYYIGKNITIRFKDESDGTGIIRERNNIYENQEPVFCILRWDADNENGRVVMIDYKNKIVVATVKDMISHLWYEKLFFDDIVFLYSGELTKEEFNEQIYAKEKIYTYGQQDKTKLLYPVISEYESERVGTIEDRGLARATLDYEYVIERNKIQHPDRDLWPDVILRSYNSYWNEHRHSEIDKPMRYVNAGYILRCDKYHIVVMEYDQDNNVRFILEDEANFYVLPEKDYYKLEWEDIHLWQNRLAATWEPYILFQQHH